MVTVVVPARNEAASVGECLGAVLAQDWPSDRLEVVVVDGGSTDSTAEIATARLEVSALARWEVVTNDEGTTPSNLNLGLELARGDRICRIDARSHVPPRYVATCVELLDSRPEVAVVGGSQIARPANGSVTATGIARALNNRYGMGGSKYRSGAPSGPTDTVYLGAFRTDELRAVGGWDERLGTNQDFELNRRMSALGHVWFEASLEVEYEGRSSLGELWRQYRRFGAGKVRYWSLTGDRPQPRQVVLMVAPVVGAAVGLVAMSTLGWRGRAGLVASGLLAGAAIELTGSSRPTGGAAVHLVSSAASAVTTTAWLTGIAETLVRGALGGDVAEAARGTSR